MLSTVSDEFIRFRVVDIIAIKAVLHTNKDVHYLKALECLVLYICSLHRNQPRNVARLLELKIEMEGGIGKNGGTVCTMFQVQLF